MKISDWILEQDISTASCDDIGLAQCFAEMEVLSALMECYAKQELIQEYCSGDIREFDIYMESGDETGAEPEEGSSESSDDSGDKKSNKFKDFMSGAGNKAKGAGSRVKETAKKWWGSVIDLIKNIGTLIVKLVSSVSYEQIKERVVESTAETWTIPVAMISGMQRYLKAILVHYKTFSNLLTSKTTDISKYKSLDNDITSSKNTFERTIDGQEKTSKDLSKNDMIAFLNEMIYIQENEIPTVKKTLKSLDYAKKDYKEMENTGEMVKIIKSCAGRLHHEFTVCNKTILDMTNTIVKSIDKGAKSMKKYLDKETNKGKKHKSDDGYNHEDDI